MQTAKGTDVGTYDQNLTADNLVATGSAAHNYEITIEVESTGYLRIDPKAVTVRADSKSKVVGTTDPTLTATITGLVGEDTVTYSLDRDPGEAVGTYTITASGEELQGNYIVTFINGTLRIRPVPTPPEDDEEIVDPDVPLAAPATGLGSQVGECFE